MVHWIGAHTLTGQTQPFIVKDWEVCFIPSWLLSAKNYRDNDTIAPQSDTLHGNLDPDSDSASDKQ